MALEFEDKIGIYFTNAYMQRFNLLVP